MNVFFLSRWLVCMFDDDVNYLLNKIGDHDDDVDPLFPDHPPERSTCVWHGTLAVGVMKTAMIDIFCVLYASTQCTWIWCKICNVSNAQCALHMNQRSKGLSPGSQCKRDCAESRQCSSHWCNLLFAAQEEPWWGFWHDIFMISSIKNLIILIINIWKSN